MSEMREEEKIEHREQTIEETDLGKRDTPKRPSNPEDTSIQHTPKQPPDRGELNTSIVSSDTEHTGSTPEGQWGNVLGRLKKRVIDSTGYQVKETTESPSTQQHAPTSSKYRVGSVGGEEELSSLENVPHEDLTTMLIKQRQATLRYKGRFSEVGIIFVYHFVINSSIYLSIYLFYSSIYSSIYLFYSSIYSSIYLFYSSIYSSIYLSIYSSIYLYIQ